MLNRVMLIGRLGAAPEIRTTKSGKSVGEFSLATATKRKDADGKMQEEVQWHKIVVWDREAENAQRYLEKGRAVCVEGELRYEKWTDKDGAERTTTKIHASRVTYLPGAAGEGHGKGGGRASTPSGGGHGDARDDAYDGSTGDDDIPF